MQSKFLKKKYEKIIYRLLCTNRVCVNAQEQKAEMNSLFNRKNLKGWYTFLKLKGKNKDPEKIFSVENGLLHISGKEFG